MADIINTIQTRVLGEAEIARLTALIEAQVTAFLNLSNSMKAAGASEAQILASTRGHAQQIKKLGDEVAATEKKIAGAKGLGGSQSLLILGQGVQDFEAAGMRGITNQVDQLAQALGVGAGLAGILTIAGVAIQVFLPHIQAFLAQFQGENLLQFAGHLETISAKVKELEKTTAKGGGTAADVLELRSLKGREKELKEGGAFLEHMREAKTEEEQAIGKEVEAQFLTPRGRIAREELIRQEKNKPGGSRDMQTLNTAIAEVDEEIRKAEKGAASFGGPGAMGGGAQTAQIVAGLQSLKAQLEREKTRVGLEEETTAGQTVGALIKEAAGADPTKLKGLTEKLEAAGFADVAAGVAGAPGTVQAKAQEKIVQEEDKKVWKPIWDKMVADEKKTHNQEVGALEAQGKIYEDMGKEDVKRDQEADKEEALIWKEYGKWETKIKKEGEKAITKRATEMARDKMAERKEMLRDPKMFGGMEQFLASVQESGVGKDREEERLLFQQMVTHLKTLAEAELAGGGGP